jgi:DNA-binding transcriptional MerR regulator
MTAAGQHPIDEYTIDELARAADTTVRSIRVYHERGVLPPPQVRGRTGFYGMQHLVRLNAIGSLLARGMKINGIKELLDAWDRGAGLDEVLGGIPPFPTATMSAKNIEKIYAGVPDGIPRLMGLGVIVRLDENTYRVENPPLYGLATRLRSAGASPQAVVTALEELKIDSDRIAKRLAELVGRNDLATATATGHAIAALIRGGIG